MQANRPTDPQERAIYDAVIADPSTVYAWALFRGTESFKVAASAAVADALGAERYAVVACLAVDHTDRSLVTVGELTAVADAILVQR